MAPDDLRRQQWQLLMAPVVWFLLIGTIALLARPDPPEPDPEATAFVGTDVLVVGDSLSVGAEPQLRAVMTGADVTIDAELGRRLGQGDEGDATDRLLAGREADPDVVVVQIGTNDLDPPTDYSRRVGAAMDLFDPDSTCVVWVLTQGRLPDGAGRLSAVNAAIVGEAALREHVSVADWAATLAGNEDVWHQPDGIHLTIDGNWGLARLVADTVVTECLR